MEINADRLKSSLQEMAQIGFVSEEKGINRLGFNDSDKEARDLFITWLEQAGLRIQIDPIGNIFGIRNSKQESEKPVIIGSHLDTVGEGGAFDGAIGVLGGLEIIRTLNDYGIQTRKPIAVADFSHEEGPRFNRNMMGSVALTGKMELADIYALKDKNSITVLEALKKIGYQGTGPWIQPDSFFELHIEQGPILEMEKKTIGVVEGIQGIAWYECLYEGFASHAGPTPLNTRRDSLLGAAELFCRLRELASSRKDGTVITVGCCEIKPNEINVIPGKTLFTLDIRQFIHDRYLETKELAIQLFHEVAEKHNLSGVINIKTEVLPTTFPENMVQLIEDGAKSYNYSFKRMPSGAGHDAQIMHEVCPTTMIFTPSLGGVSHTPLERTSYEDIAKATNVLMAAALNRAG